MASPPDLERGVAPLGPPAPSSCHSLELGLLLLAAAPALGRGDAPLGRRPCPRVFGAGAYCVILSFAPCAVFAHAYARRCLCGGVNPHLVLECQPLCFLLPVSKIHFYTDSYLGTASCFTQAPPVAQTVKTLPAMWETWVWSLGGEDPLEESVAAHSSVLAWRIPWTEEPCGLQSMGSHNRTRLSIAQHSRFTPTWLRHFTALRSRNLLQTLLFRCHPRVLLL